MRPGWDTVAIALVVWAAVIAATDWRLRKVPNSLLLAALLPAWAVLLWTGNGLLGVGLSASFLGGVLGLLLLLPGYWKSKLGAGDVKLAATFGFLQGVDGVLWTLLFSALILGAMSMLVLARWGLAGARNLRLPAAVPLSSGFTLALLLSFWGKG